MVRTKIPASLINGLEYLSNLEAWNKAKQDLEIAKAEESRLRVLLFNNGFPDAVNDPSAEGTFNLNLPHGWLLKAVVKLNTKIDEAALPEVKKELSDMGVIVDTLFAYKPSLVGKEFKKLNPQALAILSQCVTQSRGMPALELVPPKKTDSV